MAAIVNSIGNKTQICTGETEVYWKNTVILITWDDWGGWYDHVSPPIGYSNFTGGAYVYGFRVPLLVVSAYNVHGTGSFTGYISGACTPGNCPNTNPRYVHDFGSILNFTEYALGSGGQPLSFSGFPGQGISPHYPYADFLAPDSPNDPTVCSPQLCPFSLSDFFVPNLNQNPTPTPFQTITLPPGLQTYVTQWFEDNPDTPTDPDDDGMDEPFN